LDEEKSLQAPAVTSWRLTAMWGFSEAAFGGILHAFKIPFTGIFVGGAAVIFISLIAYYSPNKTQIIKSTFVVLLIKGMVSPHTPITAHLAVLMQGLIGQALFYSRSYYKTSAFILGVVTLLLSGMQKIIIVTLVFGNTIWESIDLFGEFAAAQFGFLVEADSGFKFSSVLISLYVGLHLIAGIFIGFIAGRMPAKITNFIDYKSDEIVNQNFMLNNNRLFGERRKKKKPWWKKPSGILLIILISFSLIYSYLNPEISKSKTIEILIMIVRSLFVIFIWYVWVSPFILKLFRKFLNRKKSAYSEELEAIINLFPRFRTIVTINWNHSLKYKGIKRLSYFLKSSFIGLLFTTTEFK
jgi:hypothetical protein